MFVLKNLIKASLSLFCLLAIVTSCENDSLSLEDSKAQKLKELEEKYHLADNKIDKIPEGVVPLKLNSIKEMEDFFSFINDNKSSNGFKKLETNLKMATGNQPPEPDGYGFLRAEEKYHGFSDNGRKIIVYASVDNCILSQTGLEFYDAPINDLKVIIVRNRFPLIQFDHTYTIYVDTTLESYKIDLTTTFCWANSGFWEMNTTEEMTQQFPR